MPTTPDQADPLYDTDLCRHVCPWCGGCDHCCVRPRCHQECHVADEVTCNELD